MAQQQRPIILKMGWEGGLQQVGAENDPRFLSDVQNMEFDGEQIKRRMGSIVLNPDNIVRKWLFMKELEVSTVKILIGVDAATHTLRAYLLHFPECEFIICRSDTLTELTFTQDFRTFLFDEKYTATEYFHYETADSHFIVANNGKSIEIVKRGFFQKEINPDGRFGKIYLDIRDATNYPSDDRMFWVKDTNNTVPIRSEVALVSMNERGVACSVSEERFQIDNEQAVFSTLPIRNLTLNFDKNNLSKKGIAQITRVDKYKKGGTIYSSFMEGNETANYYGLNGGTATDTAIEPDAVFNGSVSVDGVPVPFFLTPPIIALAPGLVSVAQVGIDVIIAQVVSDADDYSVTEQNPAYYMFPVCPAVPGEDETAVTYTHEFSSNSTFACLEEYGFCFNIGKVGADDFAEEVRINTARFSLTQIDPLACIETLTDTETWRLRDQTVRKIAEAKYDLFYSKQGGAVWDATAKKIKTPIKLVACFDEAAHVELFRKEGEFDGDRLITKLIQICLHVGQPANVSAFPVTFPSTNPVWRTNINLPEALVFAKNIGYNCWDFKHGVPLGDIKVDANNSTFWVETEAGFNYLLDGANWNSQIRKPWAVYDVNTKKLLGWSQKYWTKQSQADPTYIEEPSLLDGPKYSPIISPDFQVYAPIIENLETRTILQGSKIADIAISAGGVCVASGLQVFRTDANLRILSNIEGINGAVRYLFPINKFAVAVTESQIYTIDENNSVSLIRNIDKPISYCRTMSGCVVVTQSEALYVYPEFVQGFVIVRVQDLKTPIKDVVFDSNSKSVGTFNKFWVGNKNEVFEFFDGKWSRHVFDSNSYVDMMAVFHGDLIVSFLSRDLLFSSLFPASTYIPPLD